MKRNPIVVLLAAVVMLAGCDARAADGEGVGGAAAHDGWTTSFEEAKATAASQDKGVFLLFTGTEWCVPCQILEKEVLSTGAFKQWADERVVPVLLDFPAPTPENPVPVGEHRELAERFNIPGFPTIIMTDPDGRPFATVNFREPDRMFDNIKAGYSLRTARDDALARAADAEGLDKARALDEGLAAVGMPTALTFYPDTVDRIIALDPDNEAGLKQRYEQARADVRADAIVQESYDRIQHRDLDGAVAKLDEALALNPSTGLRQALTAFKGQIRLEQGRLEDASRLLDEAIALDPDSEVAPQIRALRDQVTPHPMKRRHPVPRGGVDPTTRTPRSGSAISHEAAALRAARS